MMFSKTNLSTMLIVSASILVMGMLPSPIAVHAEQCEDISGESSWGSESHGDNTPSENKFDEMVFGEDGKEMSTTCEVAEAVDKMEIKGEVKEHEWKEFKVTFVYEGTSDDVQDCFDDRFDLPDDDGDKHLADYEIQKCATGSY